MGRLVALLLCFAALDLPRSLRASTPLLFASAFGGSQTDRVNAIATDAQGNIFLAGDTYSLDFPGGSNPSRFPRPSADAFVVKLNPSGTRILYTAFLGGSGYDSARGIAIDSQGNAYITGVTTSSDLPTTVGVYQRNSRSSGLEEAFVAKFDIYGGLVYATYLGGSHSDTGYSIAIDGNLAAYVAGGTNSPDFPVTPNAPQGSLAGASDCFVTKLNSTGSAVVYSTFLGGEDLDVCKGIAVDALGSAFVTGGTASVGFPLRLPLKQNLTGALDAFLTKLSPQGDRFLFSTYLGGEGADEGNAVQVDAAGSVYVGGDTMSTVFPVTAGALQTANAGDYDGFLCRFTSNGSQLLYATYLGGKGADSITGIAIASSGFVAVSGYTASVDFPLMNPAQARYGGPFDAFLAILAPGGGTLNFATYVGGMGDDRAFGVAVLGASSFVMGGQVLSGTVPYMLNSFSSATPSQYDGFFAAVSVETSSLRFIPVTPCRVADTRNPTGPFGGPAMAATTSRNFDIPASECGIPSTAQAYSLNVTVVPAGYLSYLTIWPAGQPRPTVSTLNSTDGRVKANAAIVPAGSGGAITVYVTDQTHLVLDIAGYFVPATDPAALAFHPVTPCRIADTRWPAGPLGAPSLADAQSRTFPVLLATNCAIPASARAYSLNFTAVPKGVLSYLTTWPTGQIKPIASTLNAVTGVVTANAAIVPAGSGGSIDAYSNGNTDLVIDINGYFAPAAEGALSLYTVVPCRIIDTRLPGSSVPLSGASQAQVAVAASSCAIPAAAQAYVMNATVVPPGCLGYLTLWPQGQPLPIASTLNATDGRVTSNMAIVPTTNGSVSVYPMNPTHLILDISAYFAP